MEKRKNKITLFLILFILFSCSVSKKTSDKRYKIIIKNQIDGYYVYKVFDKKENDDLILISEKTEDCKKTITSINVLQSYDFELRKIANIKTKEGVFISLVRGLTVDSIKLSGNGKMPYLILNSCNGYLIEDNKTK